MPAKGSVNVQGSRPPRRHSRRSLDPVALGVLIAIPLILVSILGGAILFSGQLPVQVSIEGGNLTVFGAPGPRVEVPLEEVTGLSLDDSGLRVGRRVNAYRLGSVLRGTFHCKEVGECQVFADLDRPPFLIVWSKRSTVMFNAENPAETRKLYRELRSRLPGRVDLGVR